MKEFKLPDLGEGLQEAEVREWMVKEDDEITLDDILLIVETDKASVEIPSPCSGTIKKIHVGVDEIAEVGDLLVEFEESEQPSTVNDEASQNDTSQINQNEFPVNDSQTVVGQLTESSDQLQESATGIKPSEGANRIKVLPAVRMLAQKLGITLETIIPTGKKGNITLEDIKNAINLSTAKKNDNIGTITKSDADSGEFVALKGSRRAMAKNMIRSNQEVTAITLFDDADIHHWTRKTDFTIRIIEAVVHACQSESALNAHFRTKDTAVYHFKQINLGIAVDTPKGLFVPVIKNVGNLSKEEIREILNTFKLKAASQTFTQKETQGATIYLSNFGTIAGKYATPIVSPPTVAIVGIGKSFTDLKYIEGGILPRLMLPISLSADHRAVTGGEVARFLRHVMDKLES